MKPKPSARPKPGFAPPLQRSFSSPLVTHVEPSSTNSTHGDKTNNVVNRTAPRASPLHSQNNPAIPRFKPPLPPATHTKPQQPQQQTSPRDASMSSSNQEQKSPRPDTPSRDNRPRLPVMEYKEEEVGTSTSSYEEPKEEEFLAPARWLGSQRAAPVSARSVEHEHNSRLSELTKEQKMRYLAIEELVTTEKIYYDDLTIAIQVSCICFSSFFSSIAC